MGEYDNLKNKWKFDCSYLPDKHDNGSDLNIKEANVSWFAIYQSKESVLKTFHHIYEIYQQRDPKIYF